MQDPRSPVPPTAAASAIEREARRYRIMERVRRGWSYERIGDAESLTPQRIGQIVRESLARREVDPEGEHVRLQTARLEASLRLAAERVDDGELGAIDRLVRVLTQLDRYHGKATAPPPFDADADAAARFDAKLDALVARVAEEKAQAAREAARDAARPASTDFGSPATP